MDHPCHRCGAPIEEGVPFCPQCGAPQIRVAGSSVPPETSTFPPGTSGDLQPPAQPVTLTAADNVINWSNGVPAAALAGVLMAVLTAIPIVSRGACLWIFGSATLAVMFYQKRSSVLRVTTGMGVRLGLLAGLLGFFLFAILKTLWIVARHEGPAIQAQLRQAIEQAGARNSDPQAQQVMQMLLTPAGIALMATVGVAVWLLAFLLFGMAGGAAGAAIWRRQS